MEFHEKLQEFRKNKGLTQEELSQMLYVSRTAVSKWESGRGYPNIDSLKAIAKFFGITVDQLLSGEEVLTIAEEDQKERHSHFRDLVFGLLDCSMVLFFLLPFFGQQEGGRILSVSLLRLTEIRFYLRAAYFYVVLGNVLLGIATLALQNCRQAFWVRSKVMLSMSCNAAGVFLFVLSQQPYAATYLLAFLIIKVWILLKKQ